MERRTTTARVRGDGTQGLGGSVKVNETVYSSGKHKVWIAYHLNGQYITHECRVEDVSGGDEGFLFGDGYEGYVDKDALYRLEGGTDLVGHLISVARKG